MPSKLNDINDNDLVIASKKVKSISALIRLLNLDVKSGWIFKSFRERLEKLGINLSNKSHKGMNVRHPSIPIEDILAGNHPKFPTWHLHQRLLQEKVFERKCQVCNLLSWNDQAIPLELHHKSDDNQDHRLENLQLLCPNCHAQTPTHRSKNRKSRKLS